MLCSDLGSRDRFLPGAGASLWHLAVAGRLPDPLAVVALDAVVAYKVIVTHQQADVKQENAAASWHINSSSYGHHYDSNGVRVIGIFVNHPVLMERPGERRVSRSGPIGTHLGDWMRITGSLANGGTGSAPAICSSAARHWRRVGGLVAWWRSHRLCGPVHIPACKIR